MTAKPRHAAAPAAPAPPAAPVAPAAPLSPAPHRTGPIGAPPVDTTPDRDARPGPPAAPPGRRVGRPQAARRGFLTAAALRCGLYLGPISVAVAAAGPLARVPWLVSLATLLLGWAAAQALTSTGIAVARRAGPAAAARLVGLGFTAAGGLWGALVWGAPIALVGPDRGLALIIGLGGLTSLATVTAALVTRAETAIVLWSLPCWLLAAAALAGHPVGTMLPAAITVVAVRAFRPVVVPGLRGRPPRLTRTEVRRSTGYLIIGASQALCVGLLWQAGPAGARLPFWLPLLLSVPILEALIGWHTDRVDAGLDTTENAADFGRHVRRITWLTLAGLLPPLVAGVALAAAAAYLVPEPAAVAGSRDAVLALAGGLLLGGVFAGTFLLAARMRTTVAAVLAATPAPAVIALEILPIPTAGHLPNAVGVLAVTHVAGLLVVALIAADPRRTT